jgi:hypothetical protein
MGLAHYSDKSMHVLICTNYCTLVILSIKSDWSSLVQNLSERSIVHLHYFFFSTTSLLLKKNKHVPYSTSLRSVELPSTGSQSLCPAIWSDEKKTTDLPRSPSLTAPSIPDLPSTAQAIHPCRSSPTQRATLGYLCR